jgi:hypothetical protein
MDNLKNLLFIFPVMLYYFFESLIAALFVAFVWRFALQPTLGIEIGYFKWVAIIWIIKVVFFDVFKLISGLTSMNNQKQEENQE